jgi:hypothetical protein
VPDSNPTAALDAVEAIFQKLGWVYEKLEGAEPGGKSLLLNTPEPDCLAELFSNGRFAVQFGVDMEEMRNLLTGHQTEDMADDELVRMARYHLKSIVDRYRTALVKDGLEEGVDATPDYYAITFDTTMDLSDPQRAVHRIAQHLLALEKPAS